MAAALGRPIRPPKSWGEIIAHIAVLRSRLYRVSLDLWEVQEAAARLAGLPGAPPFDPPGKAPGEAKKKAVRPPARWLTGFKADKLFDGSVRVTLNGCRPLVLQPHLGALLVALAEDSGNSRDDGVAFKPLKALSTSVAKQLGRRPLSEDTINKYISRLRKILMRSAHLGHDAIQTNRGLGRRLAIRRPDRANP